MMATLISCIPASPTSPRHDPCSYGRRSNPEVTGSVPWTIPLVTDLVTRR